MDFETRGHLLELYFKTLKELKLKDNRPRMTDEQEIELKQLKLLKEELDIILDL